MHIRRGGAQLPSVGLRRRSNSERLIEAGPSFPLVDFHNGAEMATFHDITSVSRDLSCRKTSDCFLELLHWQDPVTGSYRLVEIKISRMYSSDSKHHVPYRKQIYIWSHCTPISIISSICFSAESDTHSPQYYSQDPVGCRGLNPASGVGHGLPSERCVIGENAICFMHFEKEPLGYYNDVPRFLGRNAIRERG